MRNERIIATGPCQVFNGSGYELLSGGELILCTHLHDFILGNPLKAGLSGTQLVEYLNFNSLKEMRDNMWRYPSIQRESCSE